MKKIQLTLLLMIFMACNRTDKPCDYDTVDKTCGPNYDFDYLDSVIELSFLLNGIDTIKFTKQSLIVNSHKEKQCNQNCIMANACPSIYRFNTIKTVFKGQQEYQLCITNDYALSDGSNDDPPFEKKTFQFNQLKADIKFPPSYINISYKPKVDSNITIENKKYPYVYVLYDKENVLYISNDMKILKYIDLIKMDTLVALLP